MIALKSNDYEAVPDVDDDDPPMHPKARTCTVWTFLCLFVLTGALLGGIFVVVRPRSSLTEQILAAQSQVHVTGDEVYTVEYDMILHPNATFAQLATAMLPPWYEASLMAIDAELDAKRLTPSQVKGCRQVLRMIRLLLDSVSPIFPIHSLWRQLGRQYAKGYDVVGYYQDMNLSGINDTYYTTAIVQDRAEDVLEWKAEFQHFQRFYQVRRRLIYHPPRRCGGGEVPCVDDPAAPSLRNWGRVQLTSAADVYERVRATYASVLAGGTTSWGEAELLWNFHNLRKALVVFGDQYTLFGDVLIPTPDLESMATLGEAQRMLGHTNDLWTAYRIYQSHKIHPDEQQELAAETSQSWMDFMAWADDKKLGTVIQAVLDTL